MMGVPLRAPPCYVYGDNMSVIHNMQRKLYVLKEKSNIICYHVAHESAAIDECTMVHAHSEKNPADILRPLGRSAIILVDCCFTTLLIDDYVIIILSEEVIGSLWVSLLLSFSRCTTSRSVRLRGPRKSTHWRSVYCRIHI
jgi:hypothetical protein